MVCAMVSVRCGGDVGVGVDDSVSGGVRAAVGDGVGSDDFVGAGDGADDIVNWWCR